MSLPRSKPRLAIRPAAGQRRPGRPRKTEPESRPKRLALVPPTKAPVPAGQGPDDKGYGMFHPKHFDSDNLYEYFIPLAAFDSRRCSNISAKIPEELATQIEHITSAQSTPFKTTSDIVRAALGFFMGMLMDGGKLDQRFGRSVLRMRQMIRNQQNLAKEHDPKKFLADAEVEIKRLLSESRGVAAFDYFIATERDMLLCGDADWTTMCEVWVKRIKTELFPGTL